MKCGGLEVRFAALLEFGSVNTGLSEHIFMDLCSGAHGVHGLTRRSLESNAMVGSPPIVQLHTCFDQVLVIRYHPQRYPSVLCSFQSSPP